MTGKFNINRQVDISTEKSRIKAKKQIQNYMHENLEIAVYFYRALDSNDIKLILRKIAELKIIKYQIESKADELGYSEACKKSINYCKGECCIWHFPKKINWLDFFIAISGLLASKLSELFEQLNEVDNVKYQCPLLHKDGCFFSFDNRPITCTNAYPCFAGDQFWEFKERKRNNIKALYMSLDQILQKYKFGHPAFCSLHFIEHCRMPAVLSF